MPEHTTVAEAKTRSAPRVARFMKVLASGVPAPVAGVVFGLSFVVTAYSAYAHVGPYRWLADLQLALLHEYYVQLTFIFTMLGFMILGLAVAQVARRAGLVPTAPAHSGEAPAAASAEATERRIRESKPWFYALGIGGMLLFFGARDLIEAQRGRALEHISAKALEGGVALKSSWLEVDGTPLWDAALRTGHNHDITYVPVVSAGWSQEQPVGAILLLDAFDMNQIGTAQFRGARRVDGMPNVVRAAFTDAGLRVDQAVVLEVGEAPANKRSTALILLAIGSLLFPVGAYGTVKQAASKAPRR